MTRCCNKKFDKRVVIQQQNASNFKWSAPKSQTKFFGKLLKTENKNKWLEICDEQTSGHFVLVFYLVILNQSCLICLKKSVEYDRIRTIL